MRKAIIVLGLGLSALGVTNGNAPAVAAPATSPQGSLICHLTEAGTYEAFFVSVHGMIHNLNGHGSHSGDIIPFPGFGGNPAGQNMTLENVAIFNNGCAGAVIPPSSPAVPISPAAPAPPAGVPAASALNQGFNVDGAVHAQSVQVESSNAYPDWFGASAALLAAAGAVMVWRTRAWSKNVAR